MDNESAFSKVLNLLESFQLPLILGLLGLIFVGLGFLLPKLNQPAKKEITINTGTNKQASANKIVVDVSGAVKNPGLYNLNADARVADALQAAGGTSEQVDNSWLAKNINLASKVNDGQKIYINSLAEASVTNTSNQTLGASTTGPININTASSNQLDTLPGIGEVTAGKIIAARPYNSVGELLSKKVVGQATYDKIKGMVSVY